MTRSARRLVAATLVVLAASATSLAATAAAQSAEPAAIVTGVGWWTSNPAATAPAGGFAVQAGPSGSTISQAAVEVQVSADSLDKAVLVLTEEGGVQADGAALQVCPTPNNWDPTEKGAAADAPKPECDQGKVQLARNGSSATWSADVRTLLAGAEDGEDVSLMIVPAGAGAVPVGFEVRFQKPVIDAVGATSSSSTSSSSSSSSSSFDDFGSSGSSSDSSSSSSSSSSGSSSGSSSNLSASTSSSPLPSFGTPSSFVADDGVEAAAAPPADAAVAEALAPPAASPFRAVQPVSSTSGGARGVQALFFLAVASVVGVAVGFGHARFRREATAL